MIEENLKPWEVSRKPGNLESSDYSHPRISYFSDACAGKMVLDVGCVAHDTRAYNSKYFLHRAIAGVAKHLTGLDLNHEGVENLNRLGHHVIEGDAEHFKFDKKFEVIVAADIIEHLGNVDGFFKSSINHLSDDGSIIIASPNPWYWRFILKSLVRDEVYCHPEHTAYYCLRTLRQLSARYGLEVIDYTFYSTREGFENFLPIPRRWKANSWAATLKRAG